MLLQAGDIVYVPKTLMANVVKFFQDLTSILTPIILAESGIVLGPIVKSVLTTGSAGSLWANISETFCLSSIRVAGGEEHPS